MGTAWRKYALLLIVLEASCCLLVAAAPTQELGDLAKTLRHKQKQTQKEKEKQPTAAAAATQSDDVDCKLTLNVGHSAATGQAQLSLADVTMGSLERLLAMHDNGAAQAQAQADADGRRCNVQLLWDANSASNINMNTNVDKSTSTTTSTALASASASAAAAAMAMANKPASLAEGHNALGSSQPVYELQLVVWPTDIEAATAAPVELPATVDATTATATTTRTTKMASTTTVAASVLPLYEDQLVIFPQMDFEEENLDYFFDDLPAGQANAGGLSSATNAPATSIATGSGIVKPTAETPMATTGPSTSTWPGNEPVYVVQDYHVVHPNGTTEYRLELSNGLVNYKKIYGKQLGDQLVNVQEGYDSVPIPGTQHQFQTQYYKADEHGFNVYKTEHNYRSPVLANYLHYKAKNVAAATKTTTVETMEADTEQ